MIKRYVVVCTKCKGTSEVDIHPQIGITNWRKIGSVISGRQRLDSYWGWECTCGNYSIITNQERKSIRDLTAPEPQEIEQVQKNLKMPNVRQGADGLVVDKFVLREA